MAKIWIQAAPCPWGYDGGITSNLCINSGSFSIRGYSRLTGIVFTDEALDPASGVTVQQSIDDGSNWDYVYKNTVSASTGSGFSVETVGEYARILLWATSNVDATSVRTAWFLRPV